MFYLGKIVLEGNTLLNNERNICLSTLFRIFASTSSDLNKVCFLKCIYRCMSQHKLLFWQGDWGWLTSSLADVLLYKVAILGNKENMQFLSCSIIKNVFCTFASYSFFLTICILFPPPPPPFLSLTHTQTL